MNWAAWGPTVVSVITAIFIAGMIYGKIKDHDLKLTAHSDQIEDIQSRISKGEVEVAKLQSWRDGYNAAIARHGE